MDLSMKWLSDYVKVDEPIKKFCYDMTMSGSKVERFDTEGEEISNVVVGKVLSVVPHEDSDHLVVCQVDVGKGEPIQIVTGAQNIHGGEVVPVALDGSTLPKGIKIKKGKLRGVESNGMLCSLGELGLTVHDFPYAIEDGIFVLQDEEGCEPIKIGEDIRDAIGLNDTCVEFEITSNRPDCMSVIGLAREAGATFDVPVELKKPEYKGVDGDINADLSVEVKNTELCTRYAAALVKNVKIGPSPRWMRERLRGCGVRPINNLVDITNYVMLEYGHPMHAFDLRYVSGNKIVVRNADKGEKITTLDGIERELSEEMLVIADAEKPVAVAGVMGGEYSGIMDDTTTVVFEAACFNGASVRTTAKKLGMRTDASSRFEKGLDAENCYDALMRACQLVEMLGAGEVLTKIIDKDYSDKAPKCVDFDSKWINNFLGTDIPESDMIKYLDKLGFEVKDGKAYAPKWRIDIEVKADIAEEVARIYGYNNIPLTIIRGVAQAKLTPEQKYTRKLERTMLSIGCNEISTYSFVSPKNFDKIRIPADSPLRKTVVITNPLGEDTSVMRTTIIPSMCEVLARNYNYRNAVARLYEIGNEYIPVSGKELPDEPARLAIGMYGNNVDFYDIKGAVDEIMEEMGIMDYDVTACAEGCPIEEYVAFHPGRSAIVTKGDTVLAIMGELHPETLENYEIGVKAYVAKLLIPEMMSVSVTEKTYKPLPKFPATTRDLSVVCDDSITVASLEKAIKNAVGKILEKVTLFDVYKGSQIAEGKKSVSFSISMRSMESTLTDEQADAAMKRVLKAMTEFGAELRA
ncbi:MAG: phenylalanine--tRNA ligase subunit beta [Oscillospiraceae bacterium]|nr:phenylalanine--tRNA ligase subunit beta [Oscillospiraceae bacterium]